MKAFAQTIRFKIFLAMGSCVVLMIAIGIFGIRGVSKLNNNVSESYNETTLPILDLTDVKASQLDIRLKLRRILAYRDAKKTAEMANAVSDDFRAMNKAWADYYPSHVSEAGEKAIAEKIDMGIKEFYLSVGSTLASASAGNYEIMADRFESDSQSYEALMDFIKQDIQINRDQSK